MTRLHKIFAVLLGLGALIVWRPIFEPVASGAGSAPVTVVNTPLPVTLQGTGQVSGNVSVSGSVNIANSASAPVPVKNVAEGPLTHVDRLPSDHVILKLVSPQGYFRVFSDGTLGANNFAIPADSVLVITDVDWVLEGGTPGEMAVAELGFFHVGSPTGTVYLSTSTIGSDGRAGKSDHMTSGLVVSALPAVGGPTAMVLQGYLMPAQ